MKILLLLSAFLSLSAGDPHSPDPSERVIALAREESQALDNLDHLVNQIGSRLTGSSGLEEACAWARERFASFGWKAWLQEWGTVPVRFERGPSLGRVVAPIEEPLVFGTDAWSAGTRGVVRGPALLAEGELVQRTDLRGAWLLVPEPAGCSGTGTAAEAFAPLGIAGVVRPSTGERILTGGSLPASIERLPSLPSIVLPASTWQDLARRVRDGQRVELEFDVRNHFRRGPVPQYNVVAELPGREFPQEIVLVGAHVDSWDGATGATDNGAGCAAVLEAARLIARAGVEPRRTLRFVLWSGEEQGLLGSRGMLRLEGELAERLSAVLVLDGGTNAISGLDVTQEVAADLETAFASVKRQVPAFQFTLRSSPAATAAGFPSVCAPPGSAPIKGAASQACIPSSACVPSAECRPATDCAASAGGCASDHVPFLEAGVPAFIFRQSGRADDARTHHTELDTYDAVLPDALRHNALVVALGALGLANLDRGLARGPAAPGMTLAPDCAIPCRTSCTVR